MSFNRLTSAEAERLALLSEECGEVIKAVSKILRHGYASRSPFEADWNVTNRRDLEEELGDLLGVVDFMVLKGDLDAGQVAQARDTRYDRMKPYLHHQKYGGTKVKR